MKIARLALIGLVASILFGCAKSEVAESDVKSWAAPKDSNGKPIESKNTPNVNDER